MHPGRKIMNLRCDRKISQQDLARACSITPSALSKIEAGINSPRANIIWRIAKNTTGHESRRTCAGVVSKILEASCVLQHHVCQIVLSAGKRSVS